MIRVFGSLNMDLVLEVPSIPRPGETVLAPSYTRVPGGKGANQAVAAARAGARVAITGAIGRDGFGDTLGDALSREGIDIAGLARTDAPTGIATIAVDRAGENAIAVASGANAEARADQVAESNLGPGVLVVLQMEVPARENWTLIHRAKAAGAKVILSLAPAAAIPSDVLGLVDLLLVNRIEAAMALDGLGRTGVAEGRDQAEALTRAGAASCIVTLGADGAVGASSNTVWRQPAMPTQAVDTTGAGDTFAGVLAAALDDGCPLVEAARWGAVAAALSCRQVGAQSAMPSRAEIQAALPDAPMLELVA